MESSDTTTRECRVRVKGLLLWVALALLGGCASPTAKLNQPPVDVTWETLPEYWVLVGMPSLLTRSGAAGEEAGQGVCDPSLPHRFQWHAVQPRGTGVPAPGVLDLIAISGLAQLRYRPSEQNLQAIPARIVARFEVEVK